MNVLFISPPEVLYSGGSAYSDAIKFLESAKKNYILVAISDEAQDAQGAELEKYNLLEHFELIASTKDYDMRLPDYRVINISLATLKDRFGESVDKNGCALVGSRPYEDIKCGNDAGLKTIRVMRGVYSKQDPEDISERATAKVSDLKEALFLLAPEEPKKVTVEEKPAPKIAAKEKPKIASQKRTARKKSVSGNKSAKKTKQNKPGPKLRQAAKPKKKPRAVPKAKKPKRASKKKA